MSSTFSDIFSCPKHQCESSEHDTGPMGETNLSASQVRFPRISALALYTCVSTCYLLPHSQTNTFMPADAQ